MSEQLLKALVQLFAIVANTEGITINRRKIVERLLNQQLSPTLSQQYLELFDSFVNELNERRKGKMVSVNNSVRVIKICTQINKELTQSQKAIVLVRLLELICAESQPTENDIEFTDTVATAFNFGAEEYNILKAFIIQAPESLVSKSLLIASQEKPASSGIKYLYRENLSQAIYILRIESVNIYIIRHFSHDDILLNGQLIRPSMAHILSSGSIIRSSRFQAIYYSDISAAFLHDKLIEKVDFTVDNITYTFKNGQQGLYPLSFSEATGQMIGIMGASGAGKSTLLNVLNGNEPPTLGSITVNGINIHAKNVPVKQLIGYVSQDDLLMEDLTVYENLYYSALLSFGSLTPEKVSAKVLAMLEAIGLKDRKDLKVGSPLNKKISGGQRKRLNIALELIREPYILFVDEPTSGLSSRDSENIMDLLKELSQKGKLVFVVIHQPSSDIFKLFDKLLILDTGGFPIYYGNTLDSITYFKQQSNQANSVDSECPTCGNVNPESIFSIIETKIVDEFGNLTSNRKLTPAQWKERFDKTQIPLLINKSDQSGKIPSVGGNKPSLLSQFKIFFTRDLLNKLANRQYMLINLLEAPLLAFVLAIVLKVYHQGKYVFSLNENLPSYLFMSVVVALFIGLTVSAEEIFKDRKILKREKFLDLSRFSYLNSKIAVLFILSALQMILFSVVGNLVMEIHGMIAFYWAVLFSTCCFANMLGLNISSAFNSAVTIYILIPILLIPQLLLSGVIVKFDKLFPILVKENSVPIVGNMMTSRWAFEALATCQFTKNDYESEFGTYNKHKAIANFKKDYWLIKLREKLEDCKANKPNAGTALTLIKNELTKEDATSVQLGLSAYDFSNPDTTLYIKLDGLFNKLNDYYIDMYNKYDKGQDKLVSSKYGTRDQQSFLVKKIEQNKNESLNSLMLNNLSTEKVVECGNTLVAKTAIPYLPTYKGNYQMYTTQKNLFGGIMDTIWYNIIIMWAMTIVLYFSLYFNIPAKITQIKD